MSHDGFSLLLTVNPINGSIWIFPKGSPSLPQSPDTILGTGKTGYLVAQSHQRITHLGGLGWPKEREHIEALMAHAAHYLTGRQDANNHNQT